MPNDLIDSGASWLAGVQKAHAAVTVAYHRGSESVAVDATRGSTEFEVNDDRGHMTRVESHDWMIDAVDLVLDGEQIEPDRGDTIRLILGGETHLYQVSAFAVGGVVWSWWDRGRRRYRIHTKYVGTE